MQPTLHGGGAPGSDAVEEPAPLFGRWWIWYLIVLLALGGMIAFLYWITQTFS